MTFNKRQAIIQKCYVFNLFTELIIQDKAECNKQVR